MRYLDAFRNPGAAASLRRQIDAVARRLEEKGRHPTIMEVCGTHTMAIGRYGIRDILPKSVNLVSGPGCPVCVTSPGFIDAATALAEDGAIVATFGDMMRVPGSETTLSACRAAGSRVEVCYSPVNAVEIAARNPDTPVVFLAVGFETTIPTVVSIIEIARREGLDNLSLLAAFKRVPPALKALLSDPDLRIDAFLCPAHVSAIIGPEPYEPFAKNGGVPCVIAGFEPLDILLGILHILRQLDAGVARVENVYERVVRPGGNRKARAVMERYLKPAGATWRGLGTIPGSGLKIRSPYAAFDAERRFSLTVGNGKIHPGCRCGDVLKGKIRPPECPLFATGCTPDDALGPCMVSSEGTCAAWFKYEGKSSVKE